MDRENLPERDRSAHASQLAAALDAALETAHRQVAEGQVPVVKSGFYLEVETHSDNRSVVDQLDNRREEIEVVAVRKEGSGSSIIASLYIPFAAEHFLSSKVEEYRISVTPKSGRPRNEPLIARIETVRLATALSLYTDDHSLLPLDIHQRVWWEVWLRKERFDSFVRWARHLNLEFRPSVVRFPERDVVLALADLEALDNLVGLADVVAELRRAKDNPSFFMTLRSEEQQEWGEEAISRLQNPPAPNVAVCLLDSGVRRTHPLIEPLLSAEDHHSIEPSWGPDDTANWRGHGTAMAGVILYGDLLPILTGRHSVFVPFRLESVRILPPAGQENDPELYGAITEEAISRAEVQEPLRKRVSVCAVTNKFFNDGRPSSWSSAIDQLCFEELQRRLIVLSAGNIQEEIFPRSYLLRNDNEPVEDPAQSWNALTVGAFTEKVDITHPDFAGWQPTAPAGELSPSSRTSVPWEGQWPIKPEVVLEGGNWAHAAEGPCDPIDDLQLLTTNFRPDLRFFTTIGDTSASAALAANLAGAILAERPDLWPETVRGLIVHSAEWSAPMKARVDACGGGKRRIQLLLRRYGYGVPEISRALRSAPNDVTLVVEDELRPFIRENGRIKLGEMKLHQFPWPREELSDLGPVPVEMRVTLSYFIEPNPGERGWTRKHRFASHGLRFQVKRATESVGEFRARINQRAREEEDASWSSANDSGWLLGPNTRDVGSIHSDLWCGTAADLAERDIIGIFPVGGWWKEKPQLERFEKMARYSLVVTLRAPEIDVNIYNAIENQIAIVTEIS